MTGQFGILLELFMLKDLTQAQRQRLQTLWDASQADVQYKEMLSELRELERKYEQVIQKLEDAERDVVCDFVNLCESMSWRILEIASQKMMFRFEREE